MPQRIPRNPNTGRIRWQLPRPHHRNSDPLREYQSAIADPEPPARELQGQQGLLTRLERRPALALHRKRLLQRLRVRPQHLLLRHLRTLSQPRTIGSRRCQQLRQSHERRPPARLLLVDSLVPQEPAPMPIDGQRTLRLRTGTQPERVPHDFLHTRQPIRPHRQKGGRRLHSHSTTGVSASNFV